MLRRPVIAVLAVFASLAVACPRRTPAPPDAHVATPSAAPPRGAAATTHVCYGPNASAVEVSMETPCASLGGSDTPPVEVPTQPTTVAR